VQAILRQDSNLVKEIEAKQVEPVTNDKTGKEEPDLTADVLKEHRAGKLVIPEEIAEGHVSWAACTYALSDKVPFVLRP
jgi:hypothetical protein